MVSSDEEYVPSDEEQHAPRRGRRQRDNRGRARDPPAPGPPPPQPRGRARSQPRRSPSPASQRRRGRSLPGRLPNILRVPSVNPSLEDVCDWYGIRYILELTILQLCKLAALLIRDRDGARLYRPPEVQEEIDSYLEENGNNANTPFCTHELNEFACTVDYLIKVKTNLVGIQRLLDEDDPSIALMSLPDCEHDYELTPDVWCVVPEQIPLQICQGQAFRLFGKLYVSQWIHSSCEIY